MWDSAALRTPEHQRLRLLRENVTHPRCVGCGHDPRYLLEYITAAQEAGITPAEFVRRYEGTMNQANGHFLCTPCYVAAGSPATPTGWRAP